MNERICPDCGISLVKHREPTGDEIFGAPVHIVRWECPRCGAVPKPDPKPPIVFGNLSDITRDYAQELRRRREREQAKKN